MGNRQNTHMFIPSGKRQEKVKLSDWNANPEKYDSEIQDFQDRRGQKSGYGHVVYRVVYTACNNCTSGCVRCDHKGFIKKRVKV